MKKLIYIKVISNIETDKVSFNITEYAQVYIVFLISIDLSRFRSTINFKCILLYISMITLSDEKGISDLYNAC